MQIPQALPVRVTELSTEDADALSAAQPERGREYVQLRGGRFQADLSERANGSIAFLRERWNCAVRVRCVRPTSYVAFSTVLTGDGANWCGIPLGVRNALEVDRDWEITTRGALESLSFAVERSALVEVESLLAGGSRPKLPVRNQLLGDLDAGTTPEEVRRCVERGLALESMMPEAQRAFRAHLLRLAVHLRQAGALPSARPEASSRRRRAVLKIEEYLAVHDRDLPSIADLCRMTQVSERTLEYAFREQLGMPPARYLRLRRLNRARHELRAAAPGTERVKHVAMRWGFWDVGRFAVEYRKFFGERPSETLSGPEGRPRR